MADPWAGMLGPGRETDPDRPKRKRSSAWTKSQILNKPISLSAILWLLTGASFVLFSGTGVVLKLLDYIHATARQEATAIQEKKTDAMERRIEKLQDDIDRVQKNMDRLWLDRERDKHGRR